MVLLIGVHVAAVAHVGSTRPVWPLLSRQAVVKLYHSCVIHAHACSLASCNLGADCVLVSAMQIRAFLHAVFEVAVFSNCASLCARSDIGWRKAGTRFATRQAYRTACAFVCESEYKSLDIGSLQRCGAPHLAHTPPLSPMDSSIT